MGGLDQITGGIREPFKLEATASESAAGPPTQRWCGRPRVVETAWVSHHSPSTASIIYASGSNFEEMAREAAWVVLRPREGRRPGAPLRLRLAVVICSSVILSSTLFEQPEAFHFVVESDTADTQFGGGVFATVFVTTK